MHPLAAELARRIQRGGRLAVAGLGDSLTYGWLVERGFFERFCDLLERRFPGLFLGVLNAGVPGDTVAGGLSRLDDLLARHPELLVVQFGLNDCASGVPVGEFTRDLRALLRRSIEEGVLPFPVTSSPPSEPFLRRAIPAYYGAIRNAAAEEGVPVAVLDRYWQREAPPAGSGPPLLMNDGVHPTDAGHRLLARGLLRDFLRALHLS